MIPRLDIRFPLRRQWQYWCGKEYEPREGEYLLNHARTGIIMALRVALPAGGRVGVVAYNCHTVVNAVANAGCKPVFIDITEELKINVTTIPFDLDAIVVTNLFGIRNEVEAIRKRCPKVVIIVDNAHGYGLPAEGDFTVYSINQGKFPALGEGGILVVGNPPSMFGKKIEDMYSQLPSYGGVAQVKLFCSMLIKAIAYSKMVYWFARLCKAKSRVNPRQSVKMQKMAQGITRLYNAWLPTANSEIEKQRINAAFIRQQFGSLADNWIIGENAFMLVAMAQNPEKLKAQFAESGIETETHFKHAIDWANEFGYISGTCPEAEKKTKQLIMIPTYKTI